MPCDNRIQGADYSLVNWSGEQKITPPESFKIAVAPFRCAKMRPCTPYVGDRILNCFHATKFF